MKTSTQPQTNSPASKETSSASPQSSQASALTTPTEFKNGSLDHAATAAQLESIARRHIYTKRSDSIVTKRQNQHDKKTILGLADWHQDQATEQKNQEEIYLQNELHKSAQKALTK